jgi:hypothetical protein
MNVWAELFAVNAALLTAGVQRSSDRHRQQLTIIPIRLRVSPGQPIVASTRHVDAPWIAAHLAVLNEAAVDVRLDVNFQALAAKRTGDQKLVWHFRAILLQCWSASDPLRVSCRSTWLGEAPRYLVGLADARPLAHNNTMDGSWIGRRWGD